MYAYDPLYLSNAQMVLGDMLEHAVHTLRMELRAFYGLFLATGTADDFGSGEANLLAGHSGAELAGIVLARAGLPTDETFFEAQRGGGLSREFWTGWTLAYCQWERNETFAQIDAAVPVETVRELYEPYHEMDVTAFSEFIEAQRQKTAAAYEKSVLARFRAYASLSQSQLAKRADVPVRTIQQYEQGQKDILKAGAGQVGKLAKALYISPETILRG